MNKVATYLNGHLTGEVLVNDLLLDAAQSDGSVLARRPEMIARPSNVNDIRKIMRFCSQLADKGHILSMALPLAAVYLWICKHTCTTPKASTQNSN